MMKMKTDNQVADPSGKLRPPTHALSGTDMAEITVLSVVQQSNKSKYKKQSIDRL